MQAEVRSLRDYNWHDDALCRNPDYDNRWWFPDKGGRHADVERAKAVCKKCPVRFPCLTYGTQYGEHGIWGGLTMEQRVRFRRLIKHEKALICRNCKEEFLVPSTKNGGVLYCTDRCRRQASNKRLGLSS